VLAAAVAGAWIGARHPPATVNAASSGPIVADTPVIHTERTVPLAPEHLLSASDTVPHAFSPPLSAAAAIVVDAGTGRVIWSLHPHQHRKVASLTKIMTALLALQRLAPYDVVTVDKSVPRVPLVREGLRAGEKVKAWKLF